jgi:hypothetical protein
VTAANELPPAITQQPQPQDVCPGAAAAFAVAATGAGPLSYQWQRNDTNLTDGGYYSGVTTSDLTVSGVDSSVLGDYRCVVSNQSGTTPSSAVALTISDATPPVLACGTNRTVEGGSPWSFDPPLAFDAFSGTNVTVTLAGVQTNAGYPQVITATWVATDPCGNTNTCSQAVTILPPPAPTIVLAPPGGANTSFIFTFSSVAGIDYIVQSRDALQSIGEWLPLVTNAGTGGFITNDFPLDTNLPGRFYRILVP